MLFNVEVKNCRGFCVSFVGWCERTGYSMLRSVVKSI